MPKPHNFKSIFVIALFFSASFAASFNVAAEGDDGEGGEEQSQTLQYISPAATACSLESIRDASTSEHFFFTSTDGTQHGMYGDLMADKKALVIMFYASWDSHSERWLDTNVLQDLARDYSDDIAVLMWQIDGTSEFEGNIFNVANDNSELSAFGQGDFVPIVQGFNPYGGSIDFQSSGLRFAPNGLAFSDVQGLAQDLMLWSNMSMLESATDSDGDDMPDGCDLYPDDSLQWQDSDRDGFGDYYDLFPFDIDNDGLNDKVDTDHDNDGFNNSFESDEGYRSFRGCDRNGDSMVNETEWVSQSEVYYHENDEEYKFLSTQELVYQSMADYLCGLMEYDFHKFEVFQYDLDASSTLELDEFLEYCRNKMDCKNGGSYSFQYDHDNDYIDDQIDPDDDNDGVLDEVDLFPYDVTESIDTDEDGVGDNADAFPNDPEEMYDADSDGVGDNADIFPYDRNETIDSDSDGVGDNGDAYPLNELESKDSDGDGVGDNEDAFPNDPTETMDSDGDGVGDNVQKAQEESSELPGFGFALGIISFLGAARIMAPRKE